MTTASLVAMFEPGELAEEPQAAMGPTTFQSRLGLAVGVGLLNVVALLSTAFLTICWLVFLNSGALFPRELSAGALANVVLVAQDKSLC